MRMNEPELLPWSYRFLGVVCRGLLVLAIGAEVVGAVLALVLAMSLKMRAVEVLSSFAYLSAAVLGTVFLVAFALVFLDVAATIRKRG